jgi:hypothetical protein
MEKLIIENIEFNDFGENNYSHGMRMITFYPCTTELIKRVMIGLNIQDHSVFFNPSAPCDSEFYGVFGTKEQYEKFYEAQKDAIIAKQMINKFGLEEVSRERWDTYREALEDSYKDWWHYFNPNIL